MHPPPPAWRWQPGVVTYPFADKVAAHIKYHNVVANSDLLEDRLGLWARGGLHHFPGEEGREGELRSKPLWQGRDETVLGGEGDFTRVRVAGWLEHAPRYLVAEAKACCKRGA